MAGILSKISVPQCEEMTSCLNSICYFE